MKTFVFLSAILVATVTAMPKPAGDVRNTRAAPPKLGLGNAAEHFFPSLEKVKASWQDTLHNLGGTGEQADRVLGHVTDFVLDGSGHFADLTNSFLDTLSGSEQMQLGRIRDRVGSNLRTLMTDWWDKIKSGHAPKTLLKIADLGKQYLNKYGYMSKTSTSKALANIGTLDKKALSKPIRQFQKMAGIPITGELDEETLRYMTMSRCGVEDSIGNFDDFGEKSYRARTRFGEKRRGKKNKKGNGEAKIRSKRYNLKGEKWDKRSLTYKIISYTDDMDDNLIDLAIKRALQLWADSANLRFRKTSSNNADLKISFGAGYHGDFYPFDGKGGTLAHAFFPMNGTVHFDDDEYFSHKGEGTNLMIVAAHEFGHSLGLGHSSAPNSLMAPFYQGYVEDFSLHPDDVAGIQRLYGKNVDEKAERPERPVVVSTPAPRTRSTARPRTNEPEKCTTDLDAIMESRRGSRESATYAFKGAYFYKLNDNGVLDGYPRKIGNHWRGLPGNLNAAVYSAITGYSYFFKGDKVYSYQGLKQRPGFPKKSAALGLPSHPAAALSWSGDGRIYVFKKKNYYVFDEQNRNRRPRPLPIQKIWSADAMGVDAAITWTRNGRTYFFKGNNYWRYNSKLRRMDPGYPKNVNEKWLGCTPSSSGTAARISRKGKKERTGKQNKRRKPNPGSRRRTESHVLARLVERPANGTKIA